MNELQLNWKRGVVDLRRPAARWMRLFGLGILVGILGGLAAAALHAGLEIGTKGIVERFTGLSLSGLDYFRFEWILLLLPTLGGLVSGVIVTLLVPTAGEHGANAVARAFHHGFGELPLKGPLVRAVASVGVISCGGCAGPEGPIAGLGAAIGSSIANLFKLTPRERRVLLLAGCGAGVGAIFQCPLGGALFATSIIYSEEEFESGAMVPAFVASVIAYTTFKTVIGGLGATGYMLHSNLSEPLTFARPAELLAYAALGPICGIFALFISALFHYVEERLMPRVKLPRWLTPAIGGLATGALACMLPQVMDGQYHFIQNAMTGFEKVPSMAEFGWIKLAWIFAVVAVVKCVANVCTVGSGGAGGNLGPCVFIGGAVGAALGAALEAIFPGFMTENLRQALIPVGIGGVLAASMRTPVAAMVMVIEMTGSYGLIVPLMLVCMSAYVVGRRIGLNNQQVPTSSQSPAHAGDAVVHLLESWRVSDLMEPVWQDTISPGTPLRAMIERIKPGTRPVFAVSEDGKLRGLVSVADIRRIMEDPALAEIIIAEDMMTEKLETVAPDVDVYQALAAFKRGTHQVLPVVAPDDGGRWLGMLTRERIYNAIKEALAENQRQMFQEHIGLSEIETEGKLQQLVMGVSPMKQDMIQRLLVPMDAVGQSLRETDFRKRYSAQVIAVEEANGVIRCPPDLDTPLQTGQRLIAIVWYGQSAPTVAKPASDEPSA